MLHSEERSNTERTWTPICYRTLFSRILWGPREKRTESATSLANRSRYKRQKKWPQPAWLAMEHKVKRLEGSWQQDFAGFQTDVRLLAWESHICCTQSAVQKSDQNSQHTVPAWRRRRKGRERGWEREGGRERVCVRERGQRKHHPNPHLHFVLCIYT